MFPAFAHFRRTATRDTEIAGCPIHKGEKVVKQPEDTTAPTEAELDTGNARYLIRFTQTLERQPGWAWTLFSAVRKLTP